MVDTEKIRLESGVFSDAWILMKQAYEMKDCDVNWETLIDASEHIAEKYNGTHVQGLAEDMMLSVCRHIESIAGIKKEGETDDNFKGC